MNIIKTIVKTFQNYYINLQNCSYGSQVYQLVSKHQKVP